MSKLGLSTFWNVLILLLVSGWVGRVALAMVVSPRNAAMKQGSSVRPFRTSRRHYLLETAGGLVTFGAWTTGPKPTEALEKKNEVLCGTGFFTNIAQYKCTDIGDISNDGKVTSLSETQDMATDSLLSKFGLDAGESLRDDAPTKSSTNEDRPVDPSSKNQTPQ